VAQIVKTNLSNAASFQGGFVALQQSRALHRMPGVGMAEDEVRVRVVLAALVEAVELAS
jgi:hypothetical protein